MGWWSLKQGGETLVLGDEPYDIVMDAFAEVAQAYERELGRRPTLAEVIHALETVLSVGGEAYLSDIDDREIRRLSVVMRPRSKSQRYQVGDVFVVPLENGQYAFGRILSDLHARDLGMLVGIYALTSPRLVSLYALDGQPWMFPPFYASDEGWKSGRWRIIASRPMQEGEFEYPRHKQGLDGIGWWIQQGPDLVEASADEVRGLDYAAIWNPEMVEKRITSYLGNKPDTPS